MTQYCEIDFICCCCKKSFSALTLLTNLCQFSSPDLDFRPVGKFRHAVYAWLHECPHCGYVLHEYYRRKDLQNMLSFVESEEYKSCENNSFMSELAIPSYKYGLTLIKEKDYEKACKAFLQAAWACDDNDDEAGSIVCREKSISLFDRIETDSDNFTLIKADILRRAKHFDDVIALLEHKDFSQDALANVSKLQIELARRQDVGTYIIDMAGFILHLLDSMELDSIDMKELRR